MIKVLIVEDSPVAQELLTYIFSSDPLIQVVGVADNGRDALEAVRQKRPDVITMDIHMPGMNGFEATRAIMQTQPTPIVIVSASTSAKEVAGTFRALEAGALALIYRPPGPCHHEYDAAARELIETVKIMSEVKVVRRITRPAKAAVPEPAKGADIQLVAIGASTGGPLALQQILSGLPRDFACPVLIVQHIAQGFLGGFVEWLTSTSGFPLHIAVHGEHLRPGHGYIAPDGVHLAVGHDRKIVLSDDAPENGLRPSVGYLFRSVGQVLAPHAVGVLLTGMGRDGAEELKAMRDKGAITIAQDRESSVVHGMPGEAIKLNAATHVLPLRGIAEFLRNLTPHPKK